MEGESVDVLRCVLEDVCVEDEVHDVCVVMGDGNTKSCRGSMEVEGAVEVR